MFLFMNFCFDENPVILNTIPFNSSTGNYVLRQLSSRTLARIYTRVLFPDYVCGIDKNGDNEFIIRRMVLMAINET